MAFTHTNMPKEQPFCWEMKKAQHSWPSDSNQAVQSNENTHMSFFFSIVFLFFFKFVLNPIVLEGENKTTENKSE